MSAPLPPPGQGPKKRISLVRTPAPPAGLQPDLEDYARAAQRERTSQAVNVTRWVMLAVAVAIVAVVLGVAWSKIGHKIAYAKPPVNLVEEHVRAHMAKLHPPESFAVREITVRFSPLRSGGAVASVDVAVEALVDLYRKADFAGAAAAAGDDEAAFTRAVDRAAGLSVALANEAPRPPMPDLLERATSRGHRVVFPVQVTATRDGKQWKLGEVREKAGPARATGFKGEPLKEGGGLVVGTPEAVAALAEYAEVRRKFVARVEEEATIRALRTERRSALLKAFESGQIYLGVIGWRGKQEPVVLEFTRSNPEAGVLEALLALQNRADVRKRLTGRLAFEEKDSDVAAVATMRSVFESGIQPDGTVPGYFFLNSSRESVFRLEGDQLVARDRSFPIAVRQKGAGPLRMAGNALFEAPDPAPAPDGTPAQPGDIEPAPAETPAADVANMPVAAASLVMYKEGAFPAGRVYTAAQALALLNQPAENAWLTGNFVFDRIAGNGYVLRPLVLPDPARPSEIARTLAEMEVRVVFPEGPPERIVLGQPLSATPSAPLEIIAVEQSPLGIPTVRARYRLSSAQTPE